MTEEDGLLIGADGQVGHAVIANRIIKNPLPGMFRQEVFIFAQYGLRKLRQLRETSFM